MGTSIRSVLSVDLLLYDDADIEAWLQRFVSFPELVS
jgi:hypothetical protein